MNERILLPPLGGCQLADWGCYDWYKYYCHLQGAVRLLTGGVMTGTNIIATFRGLSDC